jgi:DNA-binding NtrC family response regulator
MAKILIVDDEEMIRETLKDIIGNEGYETEEAKEGQEALNLIKKNRFDCVLLDIKMPKMDGMEVLGHIIELSPDTPVVMITGHGDEESAFEAAKKGAYDFITKPPDLNRLLVTIRNALDRANLVSERNALKQQVTQTRDIIGESSAIQHIKQTIDKVAPTDARVLVTGSNGTGKELVARWLHEKSNRQSSELVEVNCAAIPSELIESELFGHEKGSFTSAIKRHIGKFEQAHGGTLFLDEIGDMSLSAQSKVLRTLEEHKIYRVGGDKAVDVDVRVIAATNKDLEAEIEAGNFREDLYHRLSVIVLHVPSLNERPDDIPVLARHFMEELCHTYGMEVKTFSHEALEALKQVNWTGNIRELRNVIERLVILTSGQVERDDVQAYANTGKQQQQQATPASAQLNFDLEEYNQLQDFKSQAEKRFIEEKLDQNNWNISQTAEQIGIQRSHLYNKMERYEIKKEKAS